MIGWAWTAWELYRWWRDWQMAQLNAPPVGWELYECDVPDGFSWNTGPRYNITGYPCKLNTWGPEVYSGWRNDVSENNGWFTLNALPGSEWDPRRNAVKEYWSRIPGWPGPFEGPKQIRLPSVPSLPFPEVLPRPLQPMPVPLAPPVRGWRPANAENPHPRGYAEPGAAPGPSAPALPSSPPRGTKERKVAANKTTRKALGFILSQMSEAGDALDAFHDALPKEFQADGGMKDKFQALYDHWDKVDMPTAMGNLVNDMVTDPKFAKVFDKAQKEQEKWGLDLGGLKGFEGTSGIWI